MLPGFLEELQLRFWICSQGFGVAPRGLELLPGVWICSQGFGVAPRGVGLLLEYWRDKRRSDSP